MNNQDMKKDDLIKSLKNNTKKIVNAHQETVENQHLDSEFLLSLDRKSSKEPNNEKPTDFAHRKTQIVNKNINKDVGRIVTSVFINFLVKVIPYINSVQYIHYASYALITINVVYLLLKLNKIKRFEANKKKEDSLIIPININNAILRTEINNNNTNTHSTKSFFKNIETTPLSKKTATGLRAGINNNDKTNSAESSYTLSSKFTYKINKV